MSSRALVRRVCSLILLLAGGLACSSGGTTGKATGGSSSGGNAGGSAGAGPTPACRRAATACADAPAVTVTEIDLGVPVIAAGAQADTDPLPLALAPMPSGGTRLAWLGTDKKVYLAELGCDDNLIGTPASVPAEDLQDLYADETGGAVLVVRNATNDGPDNCGSGMLCGGTSSQCQSTWLVRFDRAGEVLWQTQVTNLGDKLAGYDDGAIFTWKNYQHHGRLAFDGTNFAAYVSAAITVYRSGKSGCIDIHEGDRMQVVSGDGKLLTGHQSFAWGCSHSWTPRLVWDKTNAAFVMTCATDADNCAIKRPDTGAKLFQATCSGKFFNGDLVNAQGGAYWSAWSDTETVRLNRFDFKNGQSTAIVNAGSSQHPHLVGYGDSHLLLATGAGTSLSAQVRSQADGTPTGPSFSIPVRDHVYQAFKAFPDGSVAFPAAGTKSTSVKIARVLPCHE